MVRKILVADRDPAYAQALARRIQKHCPACEVVTATDEPAFQNQLSQSVGEWSLVVSAAHFPVDSLPAGVSQLILLETHIDPDDMAHPARPVRLGSVQPILDRLDMARSGTPSASAIEGNPLSSDQPSDNILSAPSSAVGVPIHRDPAESETAMPSTDSVAPDCASPDGVHPAGPSQPRVVLLLTQTVSGRQPFYSEQRCQEWAQDGSAIHYLPLMPNLLCRQAPASNAHAVPGMTDLLLRLGGGGLMPADLGTYMAIDSLGRMQIRPTDRADDLLDCRAHDVYQMVSLLRERVMSEAESLLVIEAACVPFRSIQAIMPLCDQVEVIMPEDTGPAGQALLREIGEVLAETSASARIVQVPESVVLRHARRTRHASA